MGKGKERRQQWAIPDKGGGIQRGLGEIKYRSGDDGFKIQKGRSGGKEGETERRFLKNGGGGRTGAGKRKRGKKHKKGCKPCLALSFHKSESPTAEKGGGIHKKEGVKI